MSLKCFYGGLSLRLGANCVNGVPGGNTKERAAPRPIAVISVKRLDV